jgi:DNA ligase 1
MCVQIVGFIPTGWMYEMAKKAVREKGACSIHLVPYSEHSSYAELREYVRFLKPQKV